MSIDNFASLSTSVVVGNGSTMTTAAVDGRTVADIGVIPSSVGIGSVVVAPGATLTVGGRIRWASSKILVNSGVVTDVGEISSDPTVGAIESVQALMQSYLALEPTDFFQGAFIGQNLDLYPGHVYMSSFSFLAVAGSTFTFHGGPNDTYVIIVFGSTTLNDFSFLGTLSPNIVWVTTDSFFWGGNSATMAGNLFYGLPNSGTSGQQAVVQGAVGNTVTISPGRIIGTVIGQLAVQNNVALHITTPALAGGSGKGLVYDLSGKAGGPSLLPDPSSICRHMLPRRGQMMRQKGQCGTR